MVDKVKFWGAKRSSRCRKWGAKPRRIPTDSQRGSSPPPPPPPRILTRYCHWFWCGINLINFRIISHNWGSEGSWNPSLQEVMNRLSCVVNIMTDCWWDFRAGYLTTAWWRNQMETFSTLLALCAGNSPVNYHHKGQWRRALMFSLICAWTK